MPAPTSEDDLKRRARRRLIGAVALTLVAVIALPLMMEDEPPPAAKLEVRMPVNSKTPDFVPIAPPPVTPPVAAVAPETPTTPPIQTEPSEQAAPHAPVVEIPPAKAEAEKPKPAEEPAAKKPAKSNLTLKDESKTAVEENSAFVVQLGAFSNASKTDELKQRVQELGLSSYTDRSGELTRLRVGPFKSRDAASAAAAKLELAGIHGQVMPK